MVIPFPNALAEAKAKCAIRSTVDAAKEKLRECETHASDVETELGKRFDGTTSKVAIADRTARAWSKFKGEPAKTTLTKVQQMDMEQLKTDHQLAPEVTHHATEELRKVKAIETQQVCTAIAPLWNAEVVNSLNGLKTFIDASRKLIEMRYRLGVEDVGFGANLYNPLFAVGTLSGESLLNHLQYQVDLARNNGVKV